MQKVLCLINKINMKTKTKLTKKMKKFITAKSKKFYKTFTELNKLDKETKYL